MTYKERVCALLRRLRRRPLPPSEREPAAVPDAVQDAWERQQAVAARLASLETQVAVWTREHDEHRRHQRFGFGFGQGGGGRGRGDDR